jgi:hypothetical protein
MLEIFYIRNEIVLNLYLLLIWLNHVLKDQILKKYFFLTF